jgi:ABC-type lipoprotein release transport system permease subunit
MSETGRLPLSGQLALSLRDLRRTPRRSLVTLASVVLSMASLTFLSTLNEGWLHGMEDQFTLGHVGHVQIVGRSPGDTLGLEPAPLQPGEVMAAIRDLPSVVAATARAEASGLVATPVASAGARILALDPTGEPEVTRLREALVAGRWLSVDRPGDLLLSRNLAEGIGADLGDRVILTSQRPGGDLTSEAFVLAGVLCGETPTVDRMIAVIPLASAQRWLGLAGGATHVVLRLTRASASARVKGEVGGVLPADRYRVVTWEELDPVVSQWLRLSHAYSLAITLVVVGVVVTQVVNTLLMTVHERAREIGLLQALGLAGSEVFRVILLEALVLVAIGAGTGFLAGAGAAIYAAGQGVDLSHFAEAFQYFHMDPVIRPVLDRHTAVLVAVTAGLTAVLAGVYPAWKASRVEPSLALRGHVQ